MTPGGFSRERWMQILDALVQIEVKGPRHSDCGICFNVRQLTEPDVDSMSMLKHLFSELALDSEYPVPAPVQCASWMNAAKAYDGISEKWTGEYGKARRDLLARMIAEINAMVVSG